MQTIQLFITKNHLKHFHFSDLLFKKLFCELHKNKCHFHILVQNLLCCVLKGGYLEFSHIIELRNMHITEIYMKKQYKSSRIKNH